MISFNTLKCYKIFGDEALEVERDRCLEDIISSLRDKKTALFYGAGASAEYPSCLPVSGILNKLLKDILLDNTRFDFPIDPKVEENELNELGLETFLEFYCRALGERALEFYDILKPKYNPSYGPNVRHYFLALLAKYGHCRHFMTVNFDNAIEDAFKQLNTPIIVPEDYGPYENRHYNSYFSDSNSQKNWLFKLHGTLSDEIDSSNGHLLATVEQVGIGLPPYKRRVLESLALNRDLFFIGYGYKYTDVDVFPVIASVKSDKKVFWHINKKELFTNYGISIDIKRFISRRDGYFILTEDLTGLCMYILSIMGIDIATILTKIGAESMEEVKIRDDGMKYKRKRDWILFKQAFENKYFKTTAPAFLILANIMERPYLWNYAVALLKEGMKYLPDDNYALKYAFASNISEVYRSYGDLSVSINARKQALNYLESSNLSSHEKKRNSIYLLIRIGSTNMGLFKASSKKIFSEINPLYLLANIRLFYNSVSYYFNAYNKSKYFADELSDYDKNTINSLLNFHIADFFQYIVEASLYLGLKVTSIFKFGFVVFKYMITLPAMVAEFFYGRTVRGKDNAQSSDLYFFQMYRLAEVLLYRHRMLSQSLNVRIDGLIDESETFFKWGKSLDKIKEGNTNIALSRGLKLLFDGSINQAKAKIIGAYNEYENEHHSSGMLKAMLYLALCAEKRGEFSKVKEILRKMPDILRNYS